MRPTKPSCGRTMLFLDVSSAVGMRFFVLCARRECRHASTSARIGTFRVVLLRLKRKTRSRASEHGRERGEQFAGPGEAHRYYRK